MVEENKKTEEKIRKKSSLPKEDKEINKRINDLKIELLKQTQKRKGIKKEIARLLTAKNQTKLEDKK